MVGERWWNGFAAFPAAVPQVLLPAADFPCAYKEAQHDGVQIRRHGGAGVFE